jgi:pimeloyl-ACP methyl ester carboxylesterase
MNVNPIPVSPRGQSTIVNGIEMYYETYGEGFPLVLLHGVTQSAQVWQPFIADFAEHFGLIIPDLRGHGHSTNSTGNFMARESAADMFALLNRLAIQQCMAVGISYGSSVLLHMATQQPGRIKAMVLIGATPYFPKQARAVWRQLEPDSKHWDWAQLRQRHVHGDEQIRALLHYVYSLKDSYDDMNLTMSSLATIRATTLTVAGDHDHLFPVSIAVAMYSAIPHAYLWIVPNGDHVPIQGTRAKLFTQTTLDFLRGNWE